MLIIFDRLKQYKNELLAGTLLVLSFISSTWVFQSNKSIARQWEIRREKEAKLQKMIDLSIRYPDYRDVLYRLGVVQWELGNDQAAKDAITRVIYLDPTNPDNEKYQILLTAQN